MTISFIDLSAFICSTFGLFYIGSGLHTVVHSAVIAFTALLNTILYPHHPKYKYNLPQIVAILLITLGLASSALNKSTMESARIFVLSVLCYHLLN